MSFLNKLAKLKNTVDSAYWDALQKMITIKDYNGRRIRVYLITQPFNPFEGSVTYKYTCVPQKLKGA